MAGAAYSFLPVRNFLSSNPHSVVTEVLAPNFTLKKGLLREMVERGVCELFGSTTAKEVWKNLFQPHETIGIKVNCLAGKRGSTHPLLVEAIVEQLLDAGIPAGNIIIWDRHDNDLVSAGYSLNYHQNNRPKCFGNNFCGFSPQLYKNGSVGSLLSRNITDLCDAFINVPVMKDHSITGISSSLKNFFGGIHNPNKYHLNGGDPYIADLYELDLIRRKTRLTICDGLAVQYHGGPSYRPQWSARGNRLLLAVDAVALDRIVWQLIDEIRVANGLKTLKAEGRPPQYLLTAQKKGLGQADPGKIKLKTVNL